MKYTLDVEVLKWVDALRVIFNFTESTAVNTSPPPHLTGRYFLELPLHSLPTIKSEFKVILVSKIQFPYSYFVFILAALKTQPTKRQKC